LFATRNRCTEEHLGRMWSRAATYVPAVPAGITLRRSATRLFARFRASVPLLRHWSDDGIHIAG
jgi:hypothetical protein